MSDIVVVNLYCYENVMDGIFVKWNCSIESFLGDYGCQFGNGDILEEVRRVVRLFFKRNIFSCSIFSKKFIDVNFVVSFEEVKLC